MGSSSFARGLDISTAFEHCRSSSTSRADLNSPGPAYGCPGSTSASPGRHSISSGRHIYAPASIFMSRPAYVGPGSTPAFPRLAFMFSGWNIHLRASIWRFWPFLAGISSSWADLGHSRPALAVFWLRLGPCSGAPGAAILSAPASSSSPGWVLVRAALRLPAGFLQSLARLNFPVHHGSPWLGRRAASPGWAGSGQSRPGPARETWPG
jgi:hypothetical protein